MRPLDTLDLHRRYLAGEPLERLADSVGFTGNGLRHRFQRDGLSLVRATGPRRVASDDADLVSRYMSGASVLAIAEATGLSRPTVVRRLKAAGLAIRGGSEANLIRMAKMSPEERMRLAESAHAAVRGVPQGEEYRCKIALTLEKRGRVASQNERAIRGWLEARGITCVPQKAVGRYNVDVALTESRVAVETFGGNWHAGGSHAARFRPRVDYLADRGWHVVVVWSTVRHPLDYAVTDKIIAIHEAARRGEPLGRQEHVIRGDGYVAAPHEVNPDNGAIVLGYHPGDSVRGDDGRFR